MSCQHHRAQPERDKDRPVLRHEDGGSGVLRVYRCLDCGVGVTRFLLRSELCPNCSDPSAEGGHLGAQAWLCEPTPEVVRAALITKAILSASRVQDV
jgi:hypothetical protein